MQTPQEVLHDQDKRQRSVQRLFRLPGLAGVLSIRLDRTPFLEKSAEYQPRLGAAAQPATRWRAFFLFAREDTSSRRPRESYLTEFPDLASGPRSRTIDFDRSGRYNQTVAGSREEPTLCHPLTTHNLLHPIRVLFPTPGTLSPSAHAEAIEPLVACEDE
jgi:hypothetical protein